MYEDVCICLSLAVEQWSQPHFSGASIRRAIRLGGI